MKPLSKIGLSREEQILLQTRLYPVANEIFLRRSAESVGIKFDDLQELDYADHPEWKMKKLISDRKLKADSLEGKDTTEFDYPFVSIEEAQANGTDKHIQLEEPETVDELNEKIEKIKLKMEKKKKDIHVV